MGRGLVKVLSIIGLVFLVGVIGLPQPSPVSGQELRAVGQIHSSGPVTSEASRKIVSRLRALIADFRAALEITRGNAAAMDAAGRFTTSSLNVDEAGRVQVYVSVSDISDQTLDILRRHDFSIEIVNPDIAIVQGWVPIENLEGLAGELSVLKIRPPSYGRQNTGSVDTQGDTILRCDSARAQGFTGAGFKVGVISGGVNGLASSQASGNLPPVQIVVPQNFSDDEGTAVLEIVYDCAPRGSLEAGCNGRGLCGLPSSRSVQVGGTPATAFATIIAAGSGTAIGCSIAPLTNIPANFQYQTTNPANNQVTGAPNTPVNIPAGGFQTFVIAFTPTAPFGPTDVQLRFSCANANQAPVLSGLDTLLLSASATPTPDVLALGATLNNDGIVNIPSPSSTGAFAVATVNVGASASITASADTGATSLPLNILLCRTNPVSGQCVTGIGPQ